MIVLRPLDRVDLGRLDVEELAEYAAAVTEDLSSGDPAKISKYLHKIPPGNNQTFSDPLKVFKLWDWAEYVNIGIVLDLQSYAHSTPPLKKELSTPTGFFDRRKYFFLPKIGQEGFFSSGAIVVYRH